MALTCPRCHSDNADEAKYCLRCGAMLDTVPQPGDPLIGKVLLGRYRVIEVLGEGGMGKVYLAEQRMGTATRKVAIKTLHPELGNDPQLIARFHRECETVVELSHPNTVQFYDFGDVDGTLIIVMEYIEGESLAHVLERGPVDTTRADRILIQICGSLHEAHQRGVVHRDLKPENVLLTARGGQEDFVKVLDFGIAKRCEAEDRAQPNLTKQGMVLGTPPYMSPEQFSGLTLDPRSDVYSLGVLAYEMLAGQLPFDAQTPWEWATKHLTAEPTPIEAHPTAALLPERQRAAIMRALSKDPAARQASVQEFMHAFTGLNDPAGAWTLATTAGAMPSGAQPATPHRAHDPAAAYAPTMATPHSGQHTATASTPEAAPPPTLPGMGLGKILAIVGVVVALGGGTAAAGIVYWVTRDDGPGATTHEASAQGAPSDPVPEAPPPPPPEPSADTDSPEGDDPPDEAGPDEAAPDETGPELAAAEDPPEDTTAAQAAPKPRPTKDRARRAATAANQARTLLRQDETALVCNDVNAASVALTQARRAGARPSQTRALQSDLARKGGNQVGILMQQGRCGEAQALHRRLRSAGADGPSRVHFSDDWCPKP
jgi:eukaryotic-like serine/threonine-protein kinase